MNNRFRNILSFAALGFALAATLTGMQSAQADDASTQSQPQGQRPNWTGGQGPHGYPSGQRPAGMPAGTPPPAQQPAGVLPGAPAVTPAKSVKSAAGEQFFIVASIDLQKSQLLLKHPTEVTLLVKIDDKTQMVDQNAQPMKLSDFRAGDTVWVVSSGNGPAGPTATRIREGIMTVAELHAHYLDYPEIK